MLRRNFLGLLIATPLVPALARLAPEPEPVSALDDDAALRELGAPLDDERGPTLGELMARVGRQHVSRRVRRYILPFMTEDRAPGALVEPGRVVRLVSMAQRPFMPERLMTLPGFELLGLSVGGDPQFDVDPDASVPTELFSLDAEWAPMVRYRRADPGQQLVMVVRNVSRTALRFNATLVGDVPDDPEPEPGPRIWLP